MKINRSIKIQGLTCYNSKRQNKALPTNHPKST